MLPKSPNFLNPPFGQKFKIFTPPPFRQGWFDLYKCAYSLFQMLKVQQQVNNDVLSLYLKDKLSFVNKVLYLLLYEASNISIDY